MSEMFKMSRRQAFGLLDWLMPAANYTMAFMMWLWLVEPESNDGARLNVIYLIALGLLTYELGYQIYLKRRRTKHFVLAYLTPLIVAIGGTVGLFVAAS